MTSPGQYLTAQEAADRLTAAGVTTSVLAVRRWVREGHLKALKLPNKRIAVPESAIEAILRGEYLAA
jgi:predicted site-specific integrase-resolvase